MDSAVKDIALVNSRTYTRLAGGLKGLTGLEGFEALLKLSHKGFRYSRTEEEHQSILEEFEIPEANLVKDGECFEGFKCICGKKHIYHLNIFEWDNESTENIIIGSRCIETIAKYDELNEKYPELSSKIKQWVNIIKEETKKLTNKQCVCCKKFNVRKDYNYTNPARKYWCKNCMYGDYVKCVKCMTLRKYGFSTYYNKPYLECPSCYFNH